MPYAYQPLIGESAIRLLTLLSGSVNDPLEFTLDQEILGDCRHFEAISYVWGDPTNLHSVSCSSHELKITESLAAALRQFRQQNDKRTLWADAICINQEDLSERANQVKLMRQIYERCSSVLVWLGLEDETILPTVKLIDRIFERTHAQFRRNSPTADISEDVDDLVRFMDFVQFEDLDLSDDIPSADSPEWLSVKALFSRSWFERTWVVQEVTASNNVTVFCGNYTVSWRRLGIAAMWIHRQVMKDDYNQWRIFENTNVFEAMTMFDHAYLQDIDFLSCLSLFRGLLATDSRDKVFALLGLPPFARFRDQIAPDYTKSESNVYGSIVELSLSCHNDLGVLSYVHHDEQPLDDFPTWIPRWHIAPAAAILAGREPETEYYASGFELRLSDYGYRIESQHLTVHGLVLGEVASVSELITIDDFRDTTDLNPPESHAVRGFLHNELDMFQPHRRNDLNQLLVRRLCYTLSAGLNVRYQWALSGDDGDTKVVEKYWADFAAWILKLDPGSQSLQDIWDAFNDDEVYRGDPAEFAVAASRVCDNRRLFLFGDEYIGIGPKAMCSGDLLCVLIGGQMLYILRSKGDCYQFIGECYVDGLMYGAGLKAHEEGRQSVQEFCLR